MTTTASILDLVRPDLLDMAPYTPVEPLEVLAKELGIPAERIVKLDANENLYGPPPEVYEAIARANLHIYPDPAQRELRERVAEFTGLTSDHVVMGAGSDELIDVLIRLVDTPSIVDCPPTFGMYSVLARVAGKPIAAVPRGPAPEFQPDLDGIEAAVGEGARLVFLASPNNPTGKLLPEAGLLRLLKLPAIFAMDEAYAEFAGSSFAGRIPQHPNLVVLRTFSKWAGLAGLRVGYGLADPVLAERMAAIKQPYNVNVAGDAAAIASLEHRAEQMERVRMITAERERLSGLLSGLGWLTPMPSDANYVLAHVQGRDAQQVTAALRRRGILIRHYATPDLANYIRVTAARPEDTDRLMEALREIEQEGS
jgi:histidinol-phosphate aminotransferase